MQPSRESFLSMLRIVHCQFDDPAETRYFRGLAFDVLIAELLKFLRSPSASLNQCFEFYAVRRVNVSLAGCRSRVLGHIGGGTGSGLIQVISPMDQKC